MVLIVTAVFPPEPVVSAQISRDLAYALSEKSQVVVLCPGPSRPAGSDFSMTPEPLIPFKRIVLKSFICPGASMMGRMIESISFGWAARSYIRQYHNEISVVYANTWPLFAQLAAAQTCRKYKIPLILHVHDIYPETLTEKLGWPGVLFGKMLLPIDMYVLKHSSKVIAIGKKMAEYLADTRKISLNKIEVINNWHDETRFSDIDLNYQRNGKFTFMYLGSLSPSANVESIINAFGQAGINSSKLIIAGNGNSRNSCIKTASQFPQTDIEFMDAPAAKTPELLSMADVLLLPLKKGAGKYSIPSKLAGYMLSAKPVLTYVDPRSDTADIITSAGCGWIVPSGDEKALENRMKEVAALPGTILSMLGTSGRSYALLHLSRKANLERLVLAIERFVN